MDNSISGRILGKIGLAILAIALLDLGFLNWWVVKNDKVTRDIASALSGRQVSGTTDQKSQNDEKKQDNNQASGSSPSPTPVDVTATNKSPTTSKTSTAQTAVQTAQKEIFIPLGTGSTKSQVYTELSGLQVTIDFSKYQGIDSMVFEASVWVDGGNGRAWGELYNVDDKTLLVESQISNPTGTGVLMTSGKIPIPAMTKTYRVYAKTDLGDYVAHADNARIKITLK